MSVSRISSVKRQLNKNKLHVSFNRIFAAAGGRVTFYGMPFTGLVSVLQQQKYCYKVIKNV